jgi:alpha-tubulin suppressor-like RCC1 family protein
MLRKTSIVSIACGSYHSIAIDSENQIYCWGEARFGQTGNGKKSKEQTPKLVNVELDVF